MWIQNVHAKIVLTNHRDHPVQIQVTAQLFIWIECECKMYTPKLCIN
jgi:hypothetical protein